MDSKTNSSETTFLSTLQKEASLQSQLYSHRLLPEQLDGITSFIGRHPWQSVLFVSWLGAILTELVRWELFKF